MQFCEGQGLWQNSSAFFRSIQLLQQSSIAGAAADYTQASKSLLLCTSLPQTEIEPVQSANLCFECNHLQ